MSTQQATSSKMSSSLDTSHLKVKFPFKSKYGNFIGGFWLEVMPYTFKDHTSGYEYKSMQHSFNRRIKKLAAKKCLRGRHIKK